MIYKICPKSLWDEAVAAGVFAGAEVDLQDGFIHFSTASQMQETAAKHFSGQRDLLLLGIDESCLGDALKWEVSRGGALFPHLYADLKTSDVTRIDELPLDSHGHQVFPNDLVSDRDDE